MPCKTFSNSGESAGQNVYQPTRCGWELTFKYRGDFELPDIEEITLLLI
jgi:hypothetical protein